MYQLPKFYQGQCTRSESLRSLYPNPTTPPHAFLKELHVAITTHVPVYPSHLGCFSDPMTVKVKLISNAQLTEIRVRLCIPLFCAHFYPSMCFSAIARARLSLSNQHVDSVKFVKTTTLSCYIYQVFMQSAPPSVATPDFGVRGRLTFSPAQVTTA